MDTISPLIPVTPVGSATSQGGGKNKGNHLPQPGQIIKAKVLEVQANKIFTLEVGDTKLTAKSEASLSPGQILQLQVLKTSPDVELRIVTDTLNQVLGRSLTLIGKNFDLSKLFTTLQQTSPDLSQLSSNTKKTISDFFNLQQSTISRSSTTEQVSVLISQVRSALTTLVQPGTEGAGKTEFISSVLQLASIFKTLPTLSQLPAAEKNTLAVSDQKILSNLIEIAGKPGTPKDTGNIITQLATNLGIDLNSASSNINVPATTLTLQNSIFAFLHLLRGSDQKYDQYEQSQQNSQNQSSLDHKNSGEVLKQLIDNLGLKLEALMAKGDTKNASNNLKSALIEIASQFQNSQKIADTTNRILTTLELFQLAQLHLDNDKQLIFPLPLPFLEQGYLVINEDHKQGDGDDKLNGFSFSLHLSMKELGNMRIDFHHNGEGLFLRVHMDDDSKAEFISQYEDELKDVVTQTPLLGLSFTGDAEDPAGELIKRMLPEGKTMLDTKV